MPVAYLCLLRKQYHWHKEKLADFVIKNHYFVGNSPLRDETRHPSAFLEKIWCIYLKLPFNLEVDRAQELRALGFRVFRGFQGLGFMVCIGVI